MRRPKHLIDLALIVGTIGFGACDKPAAETEAADPKESDSPRKLAGVFPSDFKCDSIATPEVIGQTLGGTAVARESGSSVPRGVARACEYEIQMAPAPQYWTFDFDCRDNYKKSADALFAQYKQQSADLVKAFNEAADAGIKPTDAGIEIRAPEDSSDVAVGSKGLDHHGRGLIFIDDDAPCYVRIVGPDTARRFELAKLIAKNLTFVNAPMSPRAIK